MQTTELGLEIRRSGNTTNSLMVLTSNWRATLRAHRRLHRHPTFADRERVAPLAVVPMPRTPELGCHRRIDSCLLCVRDGSVKGRFSQHFLHLLYFCQNAPSLSRVPRTDVACTDEMVASVLE